MSITGLPWRRLAATALLVLGLAPGPSPAADDGDGPVLLGIVSERSAPRLAAGAERYATEHTGHEIVLRTTGQIAGLSDAALAALWQRADAVLFAAVFGDAVVPRLRRLVQRDRGHRAVIGVSSARAINRLTRLDGRHPLAGLDDATLDELTANPGADEDPAAMRRRLAAEHPAQAGWLTAHAYWSGRGATNAAGLLAYLAREAGADVSVPEPQTRAPLRYYHDGEVVPADDLGLEAKRPVVAVLDHDTGDSVGQRALLDALCEAVREQGPQCLVLLARWGQASVTALETLDQRLGDTPLGAIISLQGFVIGGGDGREAATRALESLEVPVLQGIRLSKRTEAEWRLSPDGLPADSVHYRLSMPEFQGVSQPMVLAAAEPPRIDPLTGIELTVTHPLPAQVNAIARRAGNWITLQRKANADKRIAIIYYNHPPGRHNIGADNLDVPASLVTILHRLKAAGYRVGDIPEDAGAMVERLQERGVNLPEQSDALAGMADRVNTMDAATYRRWFDTLPETARRAVSGGPVAALVPRLRRALTLGRAETAQTLLTRTAGDIRHLLEEAKHPAAPRALDLLGQLETAADEALDSGEWDRAEQLARALRDTGVPGLDGWGEAPGWVMTHDDRLILPGLTFGNVFVGPQPPRGWGVRQELLHANLAFPPPHQYLAFYHWLRTDFGADALVHLGRHSTYEFLPGPRTGLTTSDYPSLIAGDIPGIYPYIVDGVGEGLQAKRRGLAVMVDHLTPPLRTTPLYDELLGLRQLVESFESAEPDSPARERSVRRIRTRLDELDLGGELAAQIAAERGTETFDLDTLDPALLVHEVGHYLTTLQESFMPEGLHIFGREWDDDAVSMMLESMGDDAGPDTRAELTASPRHEREALLAALDGHFVPPGPGNDPIRSPDVLPTGRNFHGLNGNLLPTRVGWSLGSEMAAEARGKGGDGSEAVVLWASDTVRDEGAMVAFGLDMLGVRPVWNARGIVEGLERVPLADGRERRDVVFTTSGLFRDLYGELLVWLDRGTRLALQGSARTIRDRHPALTVALDTALGPVAELGEPGDEPLARNRIAAHWVEDTRAALSRGLTAQEAGERSVRRVYGDAPGSYGAGINRLVERSGSWQDRSGLADTYLRRLGHAYGAGIQGEATRQGFRRALGRVERSYLGRASNLYGLLDNNDAFDYLGGLSLAVETLTGEAPANSVVHLADPGDASVEPLETALLKELRGRYLNPAWIRGLMEHGYAGARTMGSEFMEYLWGWQVTNPQIVRSWAWEAVKRVYIDDADDLGLDEFLRQGNNVHVRTNMLAIMLVAIQKGFWDADDATVEQLASDFARSVIDNGLPGSGHTAPEHPMLEWVKPRLPESLRGPFSARIAAARGEPRPSGPTVTTVAEITPAAADAAAQAPEERAAKPSTPAKTTDASPATPGERPADNTERREAGQSGGNRDTREQDDAPAPPWSPYWLLAGLGVLLAGGVIRGGLGRAR
ncbi:cobaltochelatase subunit CobN [Arhodomonas aquaeolei]|uniref:cobaltochelatase subunit CobN n=1 Tax=Arhodomonas aquaeolei TaxID=2369 RepID=UPI002169A0F9|nr:cobaltochelatase subunit CobN [Arhodomonas aquaeolei]MCS4505245.1 cobaltochelatase subunit CobN [Arhodomonas aquaeolei]